MNRFSWIATLATVLVCDAVLGVDPLHYAIQVRLRPEQHRLDAQVSIAAPATRFLLHSGLDPRVEGGIVEALPVADLDRYGMSDLAVPVTEYSVRFEGTAPERWTLRYGGELYHPIESGGEEYAGSFSGSPGLIEERGAMLSQSAMWLPYFSDALMTFELECLLPSGWSSVSQGKRTTDDELLGERRIRWQCPHPMDDIYLIAAPFHEFRTSAGATEAQAFLRSPDQALADKYLEATVQYLDMYQRLIGPYPYAKFALVENFWETGWGMPSFTLLGPRIIRFPFILHSSYPHEILHNWWGNSVFVNYDEGNWCEGLTAYLADHMVKEDRGQGHEYRRDTLSNYRNYVREGRDFPLAEFRSRHSGATQAVGYGKSLMLWHMLRQRLGDDGFRLGLQRFYRQHRFTRASFSDIEKVFSATAKEDLAPFFAQWVQRTGAPELAVEVDGGIITVRQTQAGELFDVDVPVALYRDGASAVEWQSVGLSTRQATIEVNDPESLARVVVDPLFDVFRRLDTEETPPTLSQLFGSDRVAIVLPPDDPKVSTAAWRRFAESWASDGVRIVEAGTLEEIPADESVWILGANNPLAAKLRVELLARGASMGETLDFGTHAVASTDHAACLALRHPHREDLAVGWLIADREDSLPGLSSKLPHYGKYSFLAFAGAEPTNDVKGQWPVTGSPLVWDRGDRGATLPTIAAREPLARPSPVFDEKTLVGHVAALAAPDMEGRGVGTQGLTRAGDYIAQEFARVGLQPAGDDGTYFQKFTLAEGPDGKPVELRNVVGVLPGEDKDWATQSVVVGAHYDHLGRGWPDVRSGNHGKIHPGADDNASGVSVMIEVAGRLAASGAPRRSLVFVAFSGEEAGLKGSKAYLSRDRSPFKRAAILGMINLDGVGRLEGRKLKLLGAGTAYEWPHVARGIGFTTGVESTSVMDDPGGSDQRSFHEAGIPAIHLFGGAHEDYHRPTDTIDKIDGAGMVRTAVWLREAVGYLSGREEPLKAQFEKAAPVPASTGTAPKTGRRVSLGTLPDFAFGGPGVRVEKVISGSAAEAAGIRPGDVLRGIGGNNISDLKDYSDLLKQHQPGDKVRIHIDRDGGKIELEAVLRAR